MQVEHQVLWLLWNGLALWLSVATVSDHLPGRRRLLHAFTLVISYSSEEIWQIQGDIAINTPVISNSALVQHHSP